ncbi:MAG: helix-turn-helix domain-containing protein [Patescibacteria group bacterium]|nr:helix-turn-helix domain-containing protein [Patescibacteria group bacterium]
MVEKKSDIPSLTIAQAAEALNDSKESVRRLMGRGSLRPVFKGIECRVREDDLNLLLSRRTK